ncbi:cytochrome P450 [Striga asiatica]|uniref:Cytochrome P450 n=1 Tax=Striga asiatica TaxID=4170 RepID=A0A5A7QE32_STRAF|nr:cytochrome P450 [Striga asiatica]
MLKFVIVPVLSIVGVLAWQFINWAWVRPKRIERLFRKQGMKGTTYKPLLGDMKEVDELYKKAYAKPIDFGDDIVPRLMPNILDTVNKYGNFSFNWMGPRPRVYITEPSVFREIMVNYRKYKKPFKANNPIAKMLVSKGLADMEGDEWFKSRSQLNPAFHTTNLKPLVPKVQVCCENILNEWQKITSAGGGSNVIDVKEHLDIYTSSVLAQLMFNSPYTSQVKETFFKLLELESLGRLAVDLLSLPGQKYFPTKKNIEAHKVNRFIEDSFTSMINERLEKMRRGERDTTSKNRDLLEIFMEDLYNDEQTKGGGNRREMIDDIIGQCKIFFFGGFDTTSNTICWTMINLAVYKDWQNRAREEVMRVIGDKKEISPDDLSQLKVITMIMNEVLRLYPTIMEISRLIVDDSKIGEYMIPKDTLMTYPILLLNRSTELWGNDANEFKPERFADGVAMATKKYGLGQFMPFGSGPRICIGQNFSIIELKVFIALLVRKFSIDLSPSYKHGPKVDFTIQPQYGAPLILKEL